MKDPVVKLRLKDARTMADALKRPAATYELELALRRLDAVISAAEKLSARRRARPVPLPHPKPHLMDRKDKARAADEEHLERMSIIREALKARAGSPLCERCRCRVMIEPHHLFGRGKGRPLESERNCVGLCRPCHEDMQHPSSPEAAFESWDWAGRHLQELGFGEEAAMAWARAKKVRDRAEVTRAGEAVRAAEVSRADR